MLEANVGAPMSRTAHQRITSSLLGETTGPIRCPKVLRLALNFGSADPLEVAHEVLAREGFSDPEAARAACALPATPLLARPAPEEKRLFVGSVKRGELLRTLLLLGLCTPYLYDPARPVLWTRTSLTRLLHLYEAEGFYA